MSQSNGGVSTTSRLALFPCQGVLGGQYGFYCFNPLRGFNDPVNPSTYSYRVEEVATGRTPTASRIIISYRDLGQCQIKLHLSGTNDRQQVVSTETTVTLGNVVATNAIMTKFVELVLTGQNLQLTISRSAGAGPVSIVKLVIAGRVERQEYA